MECTDARRIITEHTYLIGNTMRCWPIVATHFFPKGYPILLFMISIRLKWIITNTIIKIVASCHFGLCRCCCLKSRSLSLSLPRRRAPSRQDTSAVLMCCASSWVWSLTRLRDSRPHIEPAIYPCHVLLRGCLQLKRDEWHHTLFEAEKEDEELRDVYVFCLCNKNLFTWNFNIALRTHK